jgi:hypothetical protein
LKIFSQRNSFDNDAYESTINYAPGLSINTSQYKLNGFMAGASYAVPINKSQRLFYEGKMMVGFVNATYPEKSISYEAAVGIPPHSNPIYKSNSSTSIGFGVLFGSGIRYNLSSKFVLLANAELSILNVYFRNVESTLDDVPFSTEDFDQGMSCINFMAGIAFTLK